MPSHKTRSKEDTWRPEELEQSLKEIEREKRRKSKKDTEGESHERGDEKKDRSKRGSHHESKERSRDERNGGDNRVSRQHRDERMHPDNDGKSNEQKYHKDEKLERRKHRDNRIDERKHHRDDRIDERKHHRDDRIDERKHHRDDRIDERKHHRDDRIDERKHHRDDRIDERKHHRDDRIDERKHHRDDRIDEQKHHRDDRINERKHHRDDRIDERKHHRDDRIDERKHHRDERIDERKHRDKNESGERKHRDDKPKHRRDEKKRIEEKYREESEHVRDKNRYKKEDKHIEDKHRLEKSHKSKENKESEEENGHRRQSDERRQQINSKQVDSVEEKSRYSNARSTGEISAMSRNEAHLTSTKSLKNQQADDDNVAEETKAVFVKSLNDDFDDDYEDDFEDYDDDFEEDDDDEDDDDDDIDDDEDDISSTAQHKPAYRDEDSSAGAVTGMLKKQQYSLTTQSDTYQVDNRDDSVRTNRGHSGINFLCATTRIHANKMASKSMKRARHLLAMIELDVVDFSLLDLPPINEYDMYIRSFGRSNTQQAYVQTNDDSIDRDQQTDAIEQNESWTQHPPSDGFLASSTESGVADECREVIGHQSFTAADSRRLDRFIQNSGQVMLILLEEELANQTRTSGLASQSNISISKGFVKLGEPSLLQGRALIMARFCPTLPHLVVTIHGQSGTPSDLATPAVISVWNTNEPSLPQKYLTCQSVPTCACFSPAPANLVFAGSDDGSIILWDLRESAATHGSWMAGEGGEVTVRRPSYNTAGLLHQETHSSCIIDIFINQSSGSMNDTGKPGSSYQLGSVDEFGSIQFWVVGELGKSELGGSDSDLGLSPWSRVKLVPTSSRVFGKSISPADGLSPVRLTCFQPDPNNQNQYLAGTETGAVIRCTRFGRNPAPKFYTSQPESLIEVTCLDICPFGQACFLAGFKDGTVKLYSIKRETALVDWSDSSRGHSIVTVKWSPTRPSLFYVLNDNDSLFVYDLIDRDSGPVVIESFQGTRVTQVDFTSGHMTSGQRRHRPQMLLTREDGAIEVHDLQKNVSDPQTLEAEFLESFIQRY